MSSTYTVPAAIARAHRLMQLREATLHTLRQAAAATGRPLRKKHRLNLDSAIRRSLVGAKGLR